MLCKRKSRPFRTRQACRTLPRVASVPPSSKCPFGSGVLTSFGLTRSLNRNAERHSLECNCADKSVSRRRERSPSVSLNSPRGHCTEYASRTKRCARFQSASACAGAAASSRRTRCLNAAAVNTGKPPCLLGKRRNATRPPRRDGCTIELSADPTRIVPCNAVAIGGKLVQNNGLELCALDRCCDTWDSPSAPSLSAGLAWRGLQLCCAGYFGQGCTPRERTCCYCKLTDRGPTGSTRVLGPGSRVAYATALRRWRQAAARSAPHWRQRQGVPHSAGVRLSA